jgi:predicted ribosomally synthesized peptide with SipW-like signal peptide
VKRILFSIMAVVAAIGLMGGAFAYFTDVAPSSGNSMTAGTLNLQISTDGGVNYYETAGAVIQSPAGWAPGNQFTTDPIWLKNAGTIDAQNVFGTVCKPSDSVADFSNQIRVVSVADYIPGKGWETSIFDPDTSNTWLGFWGAPNTKGYLTLADLWYYGNPGGSSVKTGFFFYDMFSANTVPFLGAGKTAAVQFTFELLKSTTNVYQGASTTFELDFTASQFLDADLDTYITGSLGQYYR